MGRCPSGSGGWRSRQVESSCPRLPCRVWSRSARSSLVFSWVGSGLFYRMTGEGRVISLGEEPLFFPHEAARFAGEPGMPEPVFVVPQRPCLAL